jgi:hypothetical protein
MAGGGASADSALTSSPAVANRSAGTLAAALTIAASSPGETVPRTMRRDGTGSIACRAMIACAFAPVNGGWPASIS